MQFAQPQFLLLGLIIIPAAALFLLWARRQQKKALNRLGDPTLIQRLSANINWSGRRWQTLLQLAALSLLIIALARPQWGSEVREIEQEGLQVIVALDRKIAADKCYHRSPWRSYRLAAFFCRGFDRLLKSLNIHTAVNRRQLAFRDYVIPHIV